MFVDMKTFIGSGEFGAATLGMIRAQLADVLGTPDQWGMQPEWQRAEILRYGSFEFYFPKHGDGLHMIFTDHLDHFEGSQRLILDPWIISPTLTLHDAETLFAREQLQFQRAYDAKINRFHLVFPSGVTLNFQSGNDADKIMLLSIHLKTVDEADPAKLSKQISVTLPLPIYEALKKMAMAQKRSTANLCSDLLIDYIDKTPDPNQD